MKNDIERIGNDFEVKPALDQYKDVITLQQQVKKSREKAEAEQQTLRKEVQEHGPTFLGFTPQQLLRLREEMGEWAFYEFLAKSKGRQQYTGFSEVVAEVRKEYKAWLQAGSPGRE